MSAVHQIPGKQQRWDSGMKDASSAALDGIVGRKEFEGVSGSKDSAGNLIDGAFAASDVAAEQTLQTSDQEIVNHALIIREEHAGDKEKDYRDVNYKDNEQLGTEQEGIALCSLQGRVVDYNLEKDLQVGQEQVGGVERVTQDQFMSSNKGGDNRTALVEGVETDVLLEDGDLP